MLRIVLGWIFTPIFIAVFFLILLVFHPIQVIGRAISYQAHKKSVDWMIICLVNCLRLTGASVKIKKLPYNLPVDRPLILVSNHQSMFDIPLIGKAFAKHHPKYIAKQELRSGIPSISYNIRHGGSITIDRGDSRQAVPAIKEFAEYLEKNHYAGCIFPEGSRARDGRMKTFKTTGLNILLKYAPNALVVPVAIQGAWQLPAGLKPVPFGMNISCTVLDPIDRQGKNSEEVIRAAEASIRRCLGQEDGEVALADNTAGQP